MIKASGDIVQMLTEAALITEEQVEKAVSGHNDRQSVTRTMIDLGYVTEEQVAEVLASKLAFPFVHLSEYPISTEAARLISDEIARKFHVLPISIKGDRIVLAMSNPADIYAMDDIQVITGKAIDPVVATESDIKEAINRFCVSAESFESTAQQAASMTEETELGLVEKEFEEDAPIIRLVDMILTQAVNERASDVHLEPGESNVRIRYRIDGVLHEVMKTPKRIQNGLTSRLKIMADMDISDRRAPQDGRCGIIVGDKAVDLRVASLPTVYGEKIVLRILEKETALLALEGLGFSQYTLERYRTSFTKPYGAILVTGPTGSGKSTTLYSTLNVLNTPEKNFITVEDPVEYRLEGINQIQINPAAGLTFATGLRSILRSDPDIIMIGEIRDKETAQIAIESALTGHLVLSTLHTNNASSALTRMIEMGIEPFLVSSSVECTIAQRLVRKLCPNCKEPYSPPDNSLRQIGITPDASDTFFRPKGCPKCNDSGYFGRIGIYEVLIVSEEIENLTVTQASADKIEKQAILEGMTTMLEDGFEKAGKGITSIEEILRVIA